LLVGGAELEAPGPGLLLRECIGLAWAEFGLDCEALSENWLMVGRGSTRSDGGMVEELRMSSTVGLADE